MWGCSLERKGPSCMDLSKETTYDLIISSGGASLIDRRDSPAGWDYTSPNVKPPKRRKPSMKEINKMADQVVSEYVSFITGPSR